MTQSDSLETSQAPILGYILTRQSYDTDDGAMAEYWIKSPTGAIKVMVANERPVCFVTTEQWAEVESLIINQQLSVTHKSLALKTFEMTPVTALYAPTLRAFYQLRDALNQHGVTVYEDDIKLPDRYMMERFINAGVKVLGVQASESTQKSGTYPTLYHASMRPLEDLSDFYPNLSLLSLDIECDRDGTLFSIGLAGDGERECDIAEVLMIGHEEPSADMYIRWYASEASLLKAFLARVQEIDPDVIVGWNVVGFDIQLLVRRFAKHRIRFTLGRNHSEIIWREPRNHPNGGSDAAFVLVPGRQIIDGIAALKTGMYQFDSFSLESVSQALLGKGKKVEGFVHDRMAEILHNYHHDKPKLAAYNLVDCQLVLDIFAKTSIMDFLIFRSQITGLALDRQGGSVAAFTHLYLPKLHRSGYVAPNLPADGGLASPGGYVMDSKPGLYHQVLVLDFKSLYPSIIRTFKIDPMGLIEGLQTPEEGIEGYREAVFHREHHHLPKLITDLWRMRDEAKRDQDKPKSQAIKILMNSFYGILGSGGCRFYDTRLASSITLRGHDVMQQTKAWIEDAGYQVIYGDTDSTFVWLEGRVSHQAAVDIGRELTSLVNDNWKQKLQSDYQVESDLEIEFETYFTRFFMPTIRGSDSGSKKRYAGLQMPLEQILGGDTSDKVNEDASQTLVFKGLESVRSDWTELAKQFQTTLYQIIFEDKDCQAYIQSTVESLLNGEYDELLVYTKRIRRPLRQYVKNISPQIRAAKNADAINEKLGRPLQYQNRGMIKYVITTKGPEALEYRQHPLDYHHYLQKQLAPIAEAILPSIGLDFAAIINPQSQLL